MHEAFTLCVYLVTSIYMSTRMHIIIFIWYVCFVVYSCRQAGSQNILMMGSFEGNLDFLYSSHLAKYNPGAVKELIHTHEGL